MDEIKRAHVESLMAVNAVGTNIEARSECEVLVSPHRWGYGSVVHVNVDGICVARILVTKNAMLALPIVGDELVVSDNNNNITERDQEIIDEFVKRQLPETTKTELRKAYRHGKVAAYREIIAEIDKLKARTECEIADLAK